MPSERDDAEGELFSRLIDPAFERFVSEHAEEDSAALALRLSGRTDVELPLACEQIRLRQRAREKLPSFHAANCLYTRKAFEQASAERVAQYRASRYGGERVLDGAAGLGVDAWALGTSFRELRLVDRNPDLCALLGENLRRLDVGVPPIECASIEDVLRRSDGEDLVFLDPDRRPDGARVAGYEDSSPDVRALWPLLERVARRVLVKLSPLLDPRDVASAFPTLVEVTVISLENEVKELLIELSPGAEDREGVLRAVDLGGDGPREIVASLASDGLHDAGFELERGVEGAFLFEAGHAVLRAGLVAEQATRCGLRLVDATSGVALADELPRGGDPASRFIGRVFRVLAVVPFREKRLARDLAELGVQRAAIVRRGFRRRYADLRARSRLADGGDTHVFFTETVEGPRVHVCERV